MAKKRNKKITLNEFKAWLEGVEELQPEDWSPNAEQWKLIRDKINSIKEEVVKQQPKQVDQQNITPQPQPQPQPAQRSAQAPSSMPLPPPPPTSGGVPSDAQIDMSPEASKMFKPGGAGEGTARTKTPDINSEGYSTSTFE